MNFFELRKQEDNVDYWVYVNEECVEIGAAVLSSSQMSSSGGGAFQYTYIEFLQGTGHSDIINYFGSSALNQVLDCVRKRTKLS